MNDVLRAALDAHRAGRFDEAEAGYRSVLTARPDDPKALYYLGLLQFHRGETGEALLTLERCVSRAPGNAHAWNTLGSMLIAAGRRREALHAYEKAARCTPSMAEAWYNLGICLRDEGRADEAVASLREAITRQPDYGIAYDALGALLYRIGRLDEAADVYGRWLTRDPANPRARHMVAALSGRDVPPRASDEYLREHFDSFADAFDESLERLEYRAPQLVAAALHRWRPSDDPMDILDAGCGTGLCGPLVRDMSRRLVGVDLSERMIDRARERGAYDELAVEELCMYLRSRPECFDAVIAADTLNYFGPLEEPLSAIRRALRPGGLTIFTLEALRGSPRADHRLGPHGRYAHDAAYVASALAAGEFHLCALDEETLRLERDEAVPGYLVVARRRD